jgi:hypothetical protein
MSVRTKKGLLILAMSLMLIGSCVVVAMAQNGVGNLCNPVAFGFLEHDTCVACFAPGDSLGKSANCLCKQIGDIYGFPVDLGFGTPANQGECVKLLMDRL